jgi:hypothetical protein
MGMTSLSEREKQESIAKCLLNIGLVYEARGELDRCVNSCIIHT